jgi:uncharacterized cysteine cluster protein YcgN (CxxCxxCC family)
MSDQPFWKRKALEELTPAEWESLCDGCGKCCLVKLQDVDSGLIAYTNVACKLLDAGTCRCSDYENRMQRVPICIKFTPENVHRMHFMPSTCAYRLVAEGKDLYWWHHLVSGDPESVHRAGVSVRGRVVPETGVEEEDLEDHIVDWPR